MIFNSSKGGNIRSALDYVEGPGRDPEAKERATFLDGDGFGFEVNEDTLDIAKRLMVQNGSREFQGEKDRYCDKDCLHLSASWDPDQAPPDAIEKRETARKLLKALGMDNSMHLVYDHNDKKHPHIHIVGSRVNPETGMAYDDYKRVERLLEAALEKEREDEIAGRRPIPEAKRQFHEAQRAQEREQERKPEPSWEDRRKAVDGLYKAHKEELRAADLGFKADEKAVSDLYRAHEREKELQTEKQMTDDGVGGRWAESAAVQDLYKAHERERQKERRQVRRAIVDRIIHGRMEKPSEKQVERVGRLYGIPGKERKHYYPRERQEARVRQEEKERAMAQDNDKWMKPLVDVWQKNRKEAKPEILRSPIEKEADTRLSCVTGKHKSPERYMRGEHKPHYPVPAPLEKAKERDIEPKRSIVNRIIERAPKIEKTKDLGREREL